MSEQMHGSGDRRHQQGQYLPVELLQAVQQNENRDRVPCGGVTHSRPDGAMTVYASCRYRPLIDILREQSFTRLRSWGLKRPPAPPTEPEPALWPDIRSGRQSIRSTGGRARIAHSAGSCVPPKAPHQGPQGLGGRPQTHTVFRLCRNVRRFISSQSTVVSQTGFFRRADETIGLHADHILHSDVEDALRHRNLETDRNCGSPASRADARPGISVVP